MALTDYLPSKSSIKKAVNTALIPLAVAAGSFYTSPKAEAQVLGGYDFSYSTDNPGAGENYRELRTVADAEATYGVGTVPSYVKNDLGTILAESLSGRLKVVVGDDSFSNIPSGSNDALISTIPTYIVGSSSSNNTVQATVAGISYLALDKLHLIGNEVSFDGDGSTGFIFGGGYLANCRITDWGAVTYNLDESFESTDNVFSGVMNPTAVWVIPFGKQGKAESNGWQNLYNTLEQRFGKNSSKALSITFERNEFSNLGVGLILKDNVNTGFGSGLRTYNVFNNVTTPVFNQQAGTTVKFPGSAWIVDDGSKALVYLTNEADILSQQVIDTGGAALIDVSDPLGFNPLTDEDNDGLTGYEEQNGLVTTQNPNGYVTDPQDNDSDDDGYTDGVEIFGGSNPNDSGSTPSGPGLPASGLVGLLLTGAAIGGAGALYARKRKTNPFRVKY